MRPDWQSVTYLVSPGGSKTAPSHGIRRMQRRVAHVTSLGRACGVTGVRLPAIEAGACGDWCFLRATPLSLLALRRRGDICAALGDTGEVGARTAARAGAPLRPRASLGPVHLRLVARVAASSKRIAACGTAPFGWARSPIAPTSLQPINRLEGAQQGVGVLVRVVALHGKPHELHDRVLFSNHLAW